MVLFGEGCSSKLFYTCNTPLFLVGFNTDNIILCGPDQG